MGMRLSLCHHNNVQYLPYVAHDSALLHYLTFKIQQQETSGTAIACAFTLEHTPVLCGVHACASVHGMYALKDVMKRR